MRTLPEETETTEESMRTLALFDMMVCADPFLIND
jgi:hypothetical protein